MNLKIHLLFLSLTILTIGGCITSKQELSNSGESTVSKTFPGVLNSVPKTRVSVSGFAKKFPDASHIVVVGGFNNSVALERSEISGDSSVIVTTPQKGKKIVLQAVNGNKVLGSKVIR